MPDIAVCKTGRHEIDRPRIWHDGVDFRARCALCEAELVRVAVGWGLFAGDERERAPFPEPALA